MNQERPNTDLRGPFASCATSTSEDVVKASISEFLQKLHTYKNEDEANAAEPQIRKAFMDFLNECDFFGTELEFLTLLAEIYGPEARREDGTISYFHQLTPIINMLALIECGDVSIEDLAPFGGIEGMMRSHLRHDSIENAMPNDWFIHQQQQILNDVKAQRPGVEREQYEACVMDSVNGTVYRLSKKEPTIRDGALVFEKGKLVKIPLYETTEDYMHQMIPHALTYALKLGDGSQNISSMLGASKFTPEKRLEYVLERWTMFGAEMGFTDKAIKHAQKESPGMAKAIRFFDHSMGAVLYSAIGYARYVDQLPIVGREPYDGNSRIYESGIGDRYISKITHVKVPPAFDTLVTKVTRMQKRANDEKVDPAERTRIKNYLNHGIYPALRPYTAHYSTLQIPANDEIHDRYDLSGDK